MTDRAIRHEGPHPARLKHIAVLKGRLGWQGLTADEYCDDGAYVVSSAHFREDRIVWSACPRVSEERYRLDQNIQLKVGDVLLMKDGAALGKLAYVDNLPGPACLNSHLLLIRPRGETFLSKFMYYVMTTSTFQDYLAVRGTGATFMGVSQEAIGNFAFRLPPFRAQVAITAFLDRKTAAIDALIAKKELLVELLREEREAVIMRAVTKGLDAHVSMKESGIESLGRVPSHWAVVQLRRVSRVGQGDAFPHVIQGHETGDLPWFKVADMNRPGNEIEMASAENFVTHEVARSAKATIFPAGAVVFPRVGAALLTNKRRILSRPSIIDDNTYAVVPNNRIRSHFLYLVLSTVDMRAISNAGLVPTVTFSAVNDLRIPLPSLAEQDRLVDYVETQLQRFDTLSARTRHSIGALREYRQSLISAAVTGKVHIRAQEVA